LGHPSTSIWGVKERHMEKSGRVHGENSVPSRRHSTVNPRRTFKSVLRGKGRGDLLKSGSVRCHPTCPSFHKEPQWGLEGSTTFEKIPGKGQQGGPFASKCSAGKANEMENGNWEVKKQQKGKHHDEGSIFRGKWGDCHRGKGEK